MVALVVGIPLTRSLNNQSPETSDTNRIESVRVSALGNHFMMFDRQWDAFEGKYNLSGSLALTSARDLPHAELTGDLFRALCGGILTQLSQMPEAPVGRADVFRITVSFPVFEDGQQTEHFFIRSKSIPVHNGACGSSEEALNLSYNTFPGALSDWGLLGFYEFTSNFKNSPELAAAFAPRTGRIAPPLPFELGCKAALYDHPRMSQQAGLEQPARLEKLAIFFVGKQAQEVHSLEREPGMVQHFIIDEGTCVSTIEPYPVSYTD